MRIITRNQWGARHGDGKGEALMPATSVWLHHSVTIAPDLEWVDANGDHVDDDEAAAMRHIEDIGVQRFGSAYGFPYSLAAMPRGHALYEGHDIDQQGAHTYGYNHTGRAIVLVGNYEKHRPTGAQLDAVAWGLVEGKRRGWWREARLSGGHRDVKATACPGKYAYAAIPEINRRAAALESRGDDMELSDHVTLNGWAAEKLGKQKGDKITVEGLLEYAGAGGWEVDQVLSDLAHVHSNVHLVNDKVNTLVEQVAWLVQKVKDQEQE